MESNLKPFIRYNLDVLFVGLNPPRQSNSNGHYFSGKQSRFFHLLYKSGLITIDIEKSTADQKIFGDTVFNFNGKNYGVVDLVPDKVETNSGKVKPTSEHLSNLIDKITKYTPMIICVIHSKVRDAFNKSKDPRIIGKLTYGNSGYLLKNCQTLFFLNYFPNGNNVPDPPKIKIFNEIKLLLS